MVFSVFPVMPFAGIPVAVCRLKKGSVFALMLVTVCCAGIFFTAGNIAALVVYLMLFGFPGIIAGEFIEKRFSSFNSILITGTAILLICSAAVFVFSGPGPTEIFDPVIEDSMKQAAAFYASAGIPETRLNEGKELIKYILSELYPVLIAFAALAGLALNGIAMGKLSGFIAGMKVPRCRFRKLKLSPWFVLMFIAGGALLLLNGFTSPSAIVKFWGENLLGISLLLYFTQGLAILTSYMETFGLNKVLKVFLYIFCFFGFMPVTVISIGLFDIWVDFRKYLDYSRVNKGSIS